ncbi:MAG: Glutamyl-tRNA amidotransferase subunit C [uncultured bacterium]|uniref:Aspartyl/glutamyl-tRNA(Asn/Gln) amidotransferase subunit C n=1 Tax=Berkelbacteria bacterium GW2011_GWA2_35_9 TaxID=1618333 RepID=A0A0G0D486_9BACT|nr:MAG: Glutamyl-tRNA amidotransferase subunit C [uncultured bacterium]KKP88118.1 MAG: Aspartyl/glutamyl-tRNA(Asn/Gln) amidotransferase subunit C [Berkelbacteria bacterium GW2011_GWA2_35_9]
MKNVIDIDTIEKIGKLSGIEIVEGEKEKYLKHFAEILDYFSALDDIDEKTVSSGNHMVTNLKDITRVDKDEESLTNDQVFLNHKKCLNKHFKVERILYNEDN